VTVLLATIDADPGLHNRDEDKLIFEAADGQDNDDAVVALATPELLPAKLIKVLDMPN
jgi:hypothetical protein